METFPSALQLKKHYIYMYMELGNFTDVKAYKHELERDLYVIDLMLLEISIQARE
jgi:hypothetical protein